MCRIFVGLSLSPHLTHTIATFSRAIAFTPLEISFYTCSGSHCIVCRAATLFLLLSVNGFPFRSNCLIICCCLFTCTSSVSVFCTDFKQFHVVIVVPCRSCARLIYEFYFVFRRRAHCACILIFHCAHTLASNYLQQQHIFFRKNIDCVFLHTVGEDTMYHNTRTLSYV